jgi:hypothetical protein
MGWLLVLIGREWCMSSHKKQRHSREMSTNTSSFGLTMYLAGLYVVDGQTYDNRSILTRS